MLPIITQLQALAPDIAAGLFSLMILATVLVRLPAFNKYKDGVTTANNWLLKVIHFLPSLGVDPRTADMEKKLSELSGQPNQNP